METIISYLENMFARLPKTKEIEKMRNDLLANMEDKYHELKREGKSENEAVGIVISEFGNIDELMQELGIVQGMQENVKPVLTENEVEEYFQVSKKSAKIIGGGVVLCILAPALLILINQLLEEGFIKIVSAEIGDILGLIPMLVMIAIAVGMFIYSGMLVKKYKYIEEEFEISYHTADSIQIRNESFTKVYTLSVIVAVALCILSPVTLFIAAAINEAAAPYGVVVLLFIVAVAVYIFVYFGAIRDCYKKLLKMDEYSTPVKLRRQRDKVIGAVAAVVWPLAACIFLVSGFIYGQWNINWIVFPITGILFGAFSEVYNILKGNMK